MKFIFPSETFQRALLHGQSCRAGVIHKVVEFSLGRMAPTASPIFGVRRGIAGRSPCALEGDVVMFACGEELAEIVLHYHFSFVNNRDAAGEHLVRRGRGCSSRWWRRVLSSLRVSPDPQKCQWVEASGWLVEEKQDEPWMRHWAIRLFCFMPFGAFGETESAQAQTSREAVMARLKHGGRRGRVIADGFDGEVEVIVRFFRRWRCRRSRAANQVEGFHPSHGARGGLKERNTWRWICLRRFDRPKRNRLGGLRD